MVVAYHIRYTDFNVHEFIHLRWILKVWSSNLVAAWTSFEAQRGLPLIRPIQNTAYGRLLRNALVIIEAARC